MSVAVPDPLDGKPGSLAKRSYLLQPFATVNIDGFRQNMDEVAAFRFGSVRGSYAPQKGSDRNVGSPSRPRHGPASPQAVSGRCFLLGASRFSATGSGGGPKSTHGVPPRIEKV